MSLTDYFCYRLYELGFDGSYYGSYMMGVCVENGPDAVEIFVEMLASSGQVDADYAKSLAIHLVEVYSRGYLTNEEAAVLTTAYETAYPESPDQQPLGSWQQPSEGMHFADLCVIEGELEEVEDGAEEFGQLEDCLPTDILSEIEGRHDNQAQPNGDDAQEISSAQQDTQGGEELELQELQGLAEVDWLQLLERVDERLQGAPFALRFPFSSEAMCAALLAARFDVSQACASLSASYSSVLACRPCRHLLKGLGCYRRDCAFHHDLKAFVCRYWLVTQCSSGEGCVFRHELVSPSSADTAHTSSSTSAKAEASAAAAEAFPALASEKTTKAQAAPLRDFKKAVQKSAGDTLVQPQQRLMAPAAAPKKAEALHALDARAFVALLKELGYLSPRERAAAGSALAPAPHGAQQQQPQLAAGGVLIEHSSWVSSGGAVSREYSRLREQAKQLGSARTRLFQEATVAYVGGAKDLARRLSQKAQQLSEDMHACQAQAARELFRLRNSKDLLLKGVLDLHGLHVYEAQTCLFDLLPIYMRTALRTVRVITGTGHHSSRGRARLFPALRELLDEERYSYVLIKDKHSGLAGGFAISLPGR